MEMTLLHYRSLPKASVTELTDSPILKYCPNCHFIPHTPHRYSGSRYGHVGDFTCERCRGKVTILDGDCRPPIRYVYARPRDLSDRGGGPTQIIVYEALYRIRWADLRQVEAWTGLTLLGETESGSLQVEPVVEMLADHVRQRGLDVREASIELPFITWIPEPFRSWLDLTSSLRRHHVGDT